MNRIPGLWRVIKWLLLASFAFILLLELTAIVGTPVWELLDLLIVPAVLAVAVWGLNKWQKEIEEKRTKNRQRQASLEKFIDRMTNLLLKEGLLEAELGDSVRTIARTLTLSAFRSLDPKRIGQVTYFLLEAEYTTEVPGAYENLIDFTDADLPGVDMSGVVLYGFRFDGANFGNAAILVNCDLRYTRLLGATMQGADLRGAECQGTIFSGAVLRDADLRGITVDETGFNSADLRGADFRSTD